MPPFALAAALALAGEHAEVDLAERLVDEALLVVLVERLARDLLRGDHGERGHLLADAVERAARLRLDLAAGLLHQLLARGSWPPTSTPPRACRPPCARARRCPPPARAPRRAGRGTPRAARRPPCACARPPGSTPRSRAALVERLLDARVGVLVEHPERDAERDQRPDHQPELGVTRKLPPLSSSPRRRPRSPREAARCRSGRHPLTRGRTRSGRR